MEQKNISIEKYQKEFLKDHAINLSLFVRNKLDERIAKDGYINKEKLSKEHSKAEMMVLNTFLNAERFLTKEEIADRNGITTNYIGSIISNLKDKFDFKVNELENNKREYKLESKWKKIILDN